MATRRRAFVLLMVLVVLAIAGTVRAAAARRCGQRALRAGEEERALQTKWGMLSLEAICLPRAEEMISETAKHMEEGPVVSLRRTLRLGGEDFHMILSDEQSKANANLLANRMGDADLADSLRLLQARSRESLQVQLRPRRQTADPAAAAPIRFESFDQLYAFEHPSLLVNPDPQETSAVDRVTCWGSGQVNLKRAEIAVIRQVLEGLVTESQLDRLERFRRETPDASLAEILGHMELSKEQLERVTHFVTDTSRCHSLWVIALGKTRPRYRLSVAETGQTENDSRYTAFAW